jgi:hypothetical protein
MLEFLGIFIPSVVVLGIVACIIFFVRAGDQNYKPPRRRSRRRRH